MFKFIRFALSVAIAMPTLTLAGPYSIPAVLTPDNLQLAVDNYATQVLTCLHVEAKEMTEGQKLWSCERSNNTSCIYNSIRNAPVPLSMQDLQAKRDQVCSTVFEKLVEKDYCGQQYGNCGEGKMTDYCLAHKAGYKDLISCNSENDHTFALFLKRGATPDKDTICIMDRWPLGPDKSERKNRGESQYYYCGATVENGNIHFKGRKLEGRDWYEKVTCSDWANETGDKSQTFSTLTPAIWRQKFLAANNLVNRQSLCKTLGRSNSACGIAKVSHQAADDGSKVKFSIEMSGARAGLVQELRAQIDASAAKSMISESVTILDARPDRLEVEVAQGVDLLNLLKK